MSDTQKAIDIITDKFNRINEYISNCPLYGCSTCIGCYEKEYREALGIAIAALQEKQHNDELRQQGRLVELPCAIGEYVYRIVKTGASETYTIMHDGHEYSREVPFWGIWDCKFDLKLIDEFGKTVFPTYEAAQEALKKMEKAEGRR